MSALHASIPPGAERREALRGHAAMLAFAAIVSGSFTLGALAAPHLPPEALNVARFALAAAALGAMAAAGPGLRLRQLAQPWRYALLGGTLAVYFVLMFVALRIASPVSTGAVFTLTPAMSAVFAWALLGQRTDRRVALALALGAAGASWVIFRGDLRAMMAFEIGRGEAIFLVGCAAHALYTPMVRLFKRDEPLLAFAFWTTLACFLAILAYALATGALAAVRWSALPPIVWGAIAYLALMASATTFVLVQFAALRLPAAKVMAYGYVTPSFVILWEGLLGHGWPAASILAGVAATACAMLFLLRG
ncbi:DMT family transporter [Oceanicella actignis]|uniref:DMT family transporter n=1 Tax=Oceanicella actignis TaxID=1189325 RepID=UPI0011E6CE61|nr:DMT family transporter [Oceanicella actignis]TYO88163.1 EamA-like transporter family protein [Oceanicella actignis]